MHSSIFRCVCMIMAICGPLPIVMAQQNESSTVMGCTNTPDLFNDWAKKAVDQAASYKEVVSQVEKLRARIERKRDVFSPLFCLTEAELKRKNEVILWKSNEFMVVIDLRNKTKALVVPRKDTTFPIDMSPAALENLAKVAATTSDAFMWATNSACVPKFSQIYINPPSAVIVSQLHVHVVPKLSIRSKEKQSAFHARVSEYLTKHLAHRDLPDCSQ